jgi:DNA-binding CsgD family transcriptional regulator
MLPERSPHPSGDDLHPDDLRTARDLLRAGQVTRALHLFESLAPQPEEPGRPVDPRDAVDALAGLVECRLARGELTPAEAAAARMPPVAADGGVASALVAHALGELATARGDHEAAATRYAEAGTALAGDRQATDDVPWATAAALALARLGRGREAQARAADQLAAARRTGSPYALAQALRTVAATSTDGGRLDLLREARACVAEVRAERLAAQIDTDLAVLLTLQGGPESRAEAVALLRGAEAYAAREDLFPLQNRVRSLLERLGEEPQRIRSETLAVLTVTEHKAARMAAEGLTNREIAGQLSVTVKAVEWHLSHVYRKLGIHSRTMLSESLGGRVPAEVG